MDPELPYLLAFEVLWVRNDRSLGRGLLGDTHPEVGIRGHSIVIESFNEKCCLVHCVHYALQKEMGITEDCPRYLSGGLNYTTYSDIVKN